MEINKKFLPTLKKINQIGKNLSNKSEYIFSNGVLIGLDDPSEPECAGLHISIIDNDATNMLLSHDFNNVIINGVELYQYLNSKEWVFQDMSQGIKSLVLVYEVPVEDSRVFKHGFIKYAEVRNVSATDAEKLLKAVSKEKMKPLYKLYKDYIMDYNYFLGSKLTQTLELHYVYNDNKIYKKSEEIIELLNTATLTETKEISNEELELISNSNDPYVINIGGSKLRVMRSLLPPDAGTDGIYMISSYKKRDDMYVTIKSVSKTYLNVSVFRIIKIN